MSISSYLKGQLNTQLWAAGSAYTPPGTFYLAMFTADPTPLGTGPEATGGSYARKAIAWEALSPDYFNNAAITFDLAAGTYTFLALFDASTAGNLLTYGYMTIPVVMASAGTHVFARDAVQALLA